MRSFWRRFVIALAILGGAHVYIWWRLVAPLPAPWAGVGAAAIAAFGVSVPVGLILGRRLPRASARRLQLVTYLWFGLAVYLLLGAGVSHVATAFGADARAAAIVAGVGALATVLYGLANVARGPRVRRVEVPLPRLGVETYTIVQLTDVHIGHVYDPDLGARIVEQVNALAPDLVVITGDFVDGPLAELQPQIAAFADLRARDGVYAVTGNHEFYWETEHWLAHLRSLGIRVLRNQHVRIADAFQLAGVDDASAGEDVPRAMRGHDPALPVVLLAHHPSTIARAVNAGVDLQLSGHTHGGQLLPLGWLIRLFEPKAAGLARFGATWLYVSEGTGYWGPPMRVGTMQEITALTLRRA